MTTEGAPQAFDSGTAAEGGINSVVPSAPLNPNASAPVQNITIAINTEEFFYQYGSNYTPGFEDKLNNLGATIDKLVAMSDDEIMKYSEIDKSLTVDIVEFINDLNAYKKEQMAAQQAAQQSASNGGQQSGGQQFGGGGQYVHEEFGQRNTPINDNVDTGSRWTNPRLWLFILLVLIVIIMTVVAVS